MHVMAESAQGQLSTRWLPSELDVSGGGRSPRNFTLCNVFSEGFGTWTRQRGALVVKI
jgi:hypothetical protein